MKILYVVSRWGEPTETFVRREVAAGLAAGQEISVLSLKKPIPVAGGPHVEHLSRWAVVVGAASFLLRHPRRASRVLRLLRGASRRNLPRHGYALALALAGHDRLSRPDWIHAHFAWLSATTAWGLSTLFGAPFGVMPHAHDIYEHELVDGLLRRKLAAASVVVVESERIRADVRTDHGRDPDVLRMGVPDDFVNAGRTHEGDGSHVVSVGALRPKKGHDVLIEAVAGIEGVHLRIVGEGDERSRLESLIGRLDVGERVTLVGHVAEDHIIAELDAADVFALASRVTAEGDRDGVPNVLIEAMARCLPVISTEVAGIPDLLLPERGSVVASNDAAALRGALIELLRNPSLRNRRAEAARAHVRDQYTVGVNWQRLEQLLEAALTS
ncbi:MAG: glycosyltransferase [Acidimicrobiales bacterium]|nr:glycosyltransferase [Acidimicrobiales bacterium]